VKCFTATDIMTRYLQGIQKLWNCNFRNGLLQKYYEESGRCQQSAATDHQRCFTSDVHEIQLRSTHQQQTETTLQQLNTHC